MMKILCLIIGHRPDIRWYWQARKMRGVQARIECERCGRVLSKPSAPPMQRKLSR